MKAYTGGYAPGARIVDCGDTWAQARALWGRTPALEALTRYARQAGLKNLGWDRGRLVQIHADGTMDVLDDVQAVAMAAGIAW